jgi:hypothetical protein
MICDRLGVVSRPQSVTIMAALPGLLRRSDR